VPQRADTQILELGNLFRAFMKRVSQGWNKQVDSGMSIAQYRMLIILKSGEPQKVSQVAEKLCITSGAITGVADKLIQSGLLERKRAEDDRRVVYMQLTPKGRKFIDTTMEMQKESIDELFAVLPEEDIQHLKRIFAKLMDKSEDLI